MTSESDTDEYGGWWEERAVLLVHVLIWVDK